MKKFIFFATILFVCSFQMSFAQTKERINIKIMDKAVILEKNVKEKDLLKKLDSIDKIYKRDKYYIEYNLTGEPLRNLYRCSVEKVEVFSTKDPLEKRKTIFL